MPIKNMPFKNGAVSSGKTPVQPPRSAVSHRKPAAKNSTRRSVKATAKAAKKTRRHSSAFSTLSSRQQAIERAKLQIWRHLEEINGAIIKLAESGSYLAARTLFEFAGVYTLPPLQQEAAAATLAALPETASPSAPPTPANRVEAFMKTLGLDQLSDDEPEPDVAA